MITLTPAQQEIVKTERARIEKMASRITSETILATLRVTWKNVPAVVARGELPLPVSKVPAKIECGIYQNDNGIFKVRPSRKGDYNIAFKLSVVEVEVWNEEEQKYEIKEKGSYSFAGAAARFVKAEERMTKEDALEYGQTHCFCVNCGKMLTAELSMERAIGPVCIKKF